MNLIKDIRKRLKIKKSILQLEFKRGERSKERELEKAAKEEAEAHRKLMASLRERQATTHSDLQSDCDREIARARKAELSAIQKSEETKKVYEELIEEAESIVEQAKYASNRNARAARQALGIVRKLETILADVVQGPTRMAETEKNTQKLISMQRDVDKKLYRARGLVN